MNFRSLLFHIVSPIAEHIESIQIIVFVIQQLPVTWSESYGAHNLLSFTTMQSQPKLRPNFYCMDDQAYLIISTSILSLSWHSVYKTSFVYVLVVSSDILKLLMKERESQWGNFEKCHLSLLERSTTDASAFSQTNWWWWWLIKMYISSEEQIFWL